MLLDNEYIKFKSLNTKYALWFGSVDGYCHYLFNIFHTKTSLNRFSKSKMESKDQIYNQNSWISLKESFLRILVSINGWFLSLAFFIMIIFSFISHFSVSKSIIYKLDDFCIFRIKNSNHESLEHHTKYIQLMIDGKLVYGYSGSRLIIFSH